MAYLRFSPTWEVSIPRYWLREGRAQGRNSPSYYRLQTLGADAVKMAQTLRQRWVFSRADEVEEKLKWVGQNLPEARLFLRAESALIGYARSAGHMFGLAAGGLPLEDTDVRRHIESLRELDSFMQAAHEAIALSPRAGIPSELAADVKQLSLSVGKLLAELGSVYAHRSGFRQALRDFHQASVEVKQEGGLSVGGIVIRFIVLAVLAYYLYRRFLH